MNDFFKKFIICVCIVGFLFSPLRPQRAYAIAIVDDCVVIGGVVITVYAISLLLEKAGQLEGFSINDTYSSDFRNYLSKKILALSAAEIAKYFFTAKDNSGSDYVALTDDGYNYCSDAYPLFSLDAMLHPTSGDTTNETTSTTGVDFMLNGFYMHVFSFPTANKVLTTFKIKAGDTISTQLYSTYHSGTLTTGSYTPDGDVYIRCYSTYSTGTVAWQYNYNNPDTSPATWTTFGTPNIRNGSNVYCYYGYSTLSGSVYVPGTDVIEQTTPIDKPSDAVVAVPISGQYASDGTTRIYDGIEGGTANAISGLKASDLSTTTPIDTGTGSDASFWSELWDWLERIYNGIRSIPGAIEALPGEIATSFENALQYVFVPTATDFSNFYNDIEGDVQSKFPYSVSILNSLEVNADEFTDIHVTIWGHDCVIVSAQFVNNNISWIRVVTSCFWIFSLFVYVWRKINSVLNGGDVNSTTVYAPGGGGSGPPSVI